MDSPSPSTWKASLAIGGMTCGACAESIRTRLNNLDGIFNVTVDSLTNSASVELDDKAKVGEVVEAIEELGYDAQLDKVLGPEDEEKSAHSRTVEVHIDGFHCDLCPGRAINSLLAFPISVDSISKPTRDRPIIKITYSPKSPTLTIRHILAAIEASSPSFKASIYHPPTLEERSKAFHARQQKSMCIRVVLTFIVAIPTFVIGIVYMDLIPDGNTAKTYLMAPWTSGISRAQMALFIMATPVYLFAADIFHRRAVKELLSLWKPGSKTPLLQRFYRFGSMNMLISLGTSIAYISSCAQLVAAGVDRPANVNNSDFYFDSVVFLTLFLLVGRLIEAYSKSKAGDAVEMLSKLRPPTAILVDGGERSEEGDRVVAVDWLEFGDIIRVQHGASPPCDGKVIQGETKFDESSLTGESRLIKKAFGDEVFAGTVNRDSPILVQVTGAAGQSMLDQIVNVVREGQTKRAPMEKIADVLTAYFVPAITSIAILTWLIWFILGTTGVLPSDYLDESSSGGWVAFSLQFAIAVFVVACPCGLGLAAPTAIFVGGGLAARQGILAKGGGEAFEKASHLDCVVFDKTGTLTTGGQPSITDHAFYIDEQPNIILAVIRAVEQNSSHPIANAIVAFCDSKTKEHVDVSDVEEIPGRGLKATYSGKHIIIGNETLMNDFGVILPAEAAGTLLQWKKEAKSVAIVATSSSLDDSNPYTITAAFSISDPVRPETASVIHALHKKNIDVWMLSGDNITTARAVALNIGIPETNVIAEVLPADKASKITYLQSILTTKGKHGSRATVAMVGDGINDAPALAIADVGIAIGSGSDVAISSADFVLLKSDLRSVVTLLGLTKTVFRRIKFNFGWAIIYNVLAVPVAAGCFYAINAPGGHVKLDPVWASLAMALSSISVVLSSLALRIRIHGLGYKEEEINI